MSAALHDGPCGPWAQLDTLAKVVGVPRRTLYRRATLHQCLRLPAVRVGEPAFYCFQCVTVATYRGLKVGTEGDEPLTGRAA